MSDRALRRLGRVVAACGVLAATGTIVVHLALGLWREGVDDFAIVTAFTCLTMSVVVLVAHPGNLRNRSLQVGLWGIGFMAGELAGQVVGLPLVAAHVGRPVSPLTAGSIAPADLSAVAATALWFTSWAWLPGMILTLGLTFLRFPDGTLLTPRWRWLERSTLVGLACTSIAMAVAWVPGSATPYSTDSFDAGLAPLLTVGWSLILVGVFGTVTSLVLRSRRAPAVVRHQIRWVAFPAVLGVLAAAVAVPIDEDVAAYLTLPVGPMVVIVYGMAITRHRLYDVDLVINRTVVFGVLAAFITAVYVAVVVGIGTLVGDTSSVVLSITATAVVAVAFEPIRERVQHAANVLVHGERATPYEVLAGMTDAGADDGGVQRAATLLGEGTGAAEVVVWRRGRTDLRPVCAWPDPVVLAHLAPVPVAGRRAALAGDLVRDLVHAESLVGAVTVRKHRGEPVRSTDRRLVGEFAGQAAVLVANARLTSELHHRLTELAASRRRLVATQDDARRRLERNIHDGAQQSLVALKVKLGLARTLAVREDLTNVVSLIDDLTSDADAAVTSLRTLARGIYPPLLEAEGLAAALRGHLRHAPIPAEFRAGDIGRHTRDVEVAVHACVLEAVRNAVVHGRASQVVVTLTQDRELTFTVSDDGHGFSPDTTHTGTGLPGMHDRLDIVAGTLEVHSRPGAGTVIRGVVPLPAPADGPDAPAALVGASP